MITDLDYALLASAPYYDTRDEINRFPLPLNWSLRSRIPQDGSTGFEASTYINGTDIVISFAGTNPNSLLDPDNAANIGLATGFGSDQLLQAAEYYLQVKAANPNTNISFTGHSLGGGLAALIINGDYKWGQTRLIGLDALRPTFRQRRRPAFG